MFGAVDVLELLFFWLVVLPSVALFVAPPIVLGPPAALLAWRFGRERIAVDETTRAW